MYSKVPKVLHRILGKPIIRFVVDLSHELLCDDIIVVVGKQAKAIREAAGTGLRFVIQSVPRGTGDAARLGIVKSRNPDILILSGDVPLLRKRTITAMIEAHRQRHADLTLLSCTVVDPYGYGRIIRRKSGHIKDIVEESDASLRQRRIREINAGIYFGARDILQKHLPKLKTTNVQGEYYLTDVVRTIIKERKKVHVHKIDDEMETMGINTQAHLAQARECIKKYWFDELMKRGVRIEDPTTTSVDLSVNIGDHVHIRPFSLIEGNTIIRNNEVIGPFVWIKDGIIMKPYKDV